MYEETGAGELIKNPMIMYVIVVAKVEARTSNANTNHLLTNFELTTI
jgi:hypothetical protein